MILSNMKGPGQVLPVVEQFLGKTTGSPQYPP
jgi:hypothetical protein